MNTGPVQAPGLTEIRHPVRNPTPPPWIVEPVPLRRLALRLPCGSAEVSMRAVVWFCDVLHLSMLLACLGPALGVMLWSSGWLPPLLAATMVMLPLASSIAAVIFLDVQLIWRTPALGGKGWWTVAVLCLPVLAAPVLWWGIGRHLMLHPARPSQRRPAAAPVNTRAAPAIAPACGLPDTLIIHAKTGDRQPPTPVNLYSACDTTVSCTQNETYRTEWERIGAGPEEPTEQIRPVIRASHTTRPIRPLPIYGR